MRGNKKGLSNIVTILLMIVLALAAVAAVWGVVNNIIQSGTEDVELSSKCLKVDIGLVKSDCTTLGICNVTLTRNPGGEDIAGVKLVFTNDLGETNYVHDVSGNIDLLETKTVLNINTGITDVTNVEVKLYFKDKVGNDLLCPV